MDNKCIFCKIIAGEIPAYKIYEDNNFIAILDINPIHIGHTLIIPKAHFINIFDAPEEILPKIGPLAQKLARAIKESVRADGINIGWNNESSAGQIIFHSHIHIIPRFEGDGFAHWQGQDINTPTDFENTQKSIKKALI